MRTLLYLCPLPHRTPATAPHSRRASQDELRRLGWRLLTCEAAVVCALSNKASLRRLAEARGLDAYLPRHYSSVREAEAAAAYPCVLKAAEGEFGRNVHIVRSSEEARRGSHGSEPCSLTTQGVTCIIHSRD